MIKRSVRKLISSLGYQVYKTPPANAVKGNFEYIDMDKYHVLPKASITYADDLLYTSHNCDFMKDARFMQSYNLGKATDVNETVLKNYNIYWRIHVLCWAANYAKGLAGDFVDCGVNTGIFSRAVINYIDFNATGKKYYLLDTFTGLDERFSSEDEMGQMLNQKYTQHKDTLYTQVQNTFKGFNVEIIKGAVPETLPQVKAKQVAYLSVDMNCIRPEVDALEYFWDMMTPGGIIILDDYGYGNITNDQKHAHDEFARSKGVEVLSMPTCQGIIIKPPHLN